MSNPPPSAPGGPPADAGPELSTTAKLALTHILDNASAPAEVSMRLVAGDGGFELLPDVEKPGDETHEHDGRTVLLIAPDVRTRLAGFVVDAEEHDQVTRFTIARSA